MTIPTPSQTLDPSTEVGLGYFMLALLVAAVLIYALYTENFPLRVRGISRAEEPGSFWGFFVLYFAMFMFAVGKSMGF
jgi:hypothetical protein